MTPQAGQDHRAAFRTKCVTPLVTLAQPHPPACSPADPEPPEVSLKQLAGVLDRLSTLAAALPQSTFEQGP